MKKILIFCICLLTSFALNAQEFNGYVKSNLSSSVYWNNTLRLKSLVPVNQNSGVEFAYDLYLQYFEVSPSVTSSDKSYRVTDLSDTLATHEIDSVTTGGIRAAQNLDRLSFGYNSEKFDFQLGRIPVSFGSARVINPTDVIVPKGIVVIDSEERYGVDAIRFRKTFGDMGEIDVGVIGGEHLHQSESAIFLNLRRLIGQWYLTSTVMRYKENFLAGLDWQGEILGFGIWFEYAYNFIKESQDYSRLSLGGEYVFNPDLLFFLEYHHNGAGTRDRKDYFFNAQTTAYSKGGIFLLAKDYITPGLSYQLTPLVGCSASAIININDFSTLLSPKLEYNFKEDLYLDLGVVAGIGDKVFDEFGVYPDHIYTLLRYYF